MTKLFSFETAHLFGDVLPASMRLRHTIFVIDQRYDVPSYNAMEYDQFDTPAAMYMLWHTPDGNPGAVARLIPTTQPYMIQKLWADLIPNGTIPSDGHTWEISRFGIDKSLKPVVKRAAMKEMACSFAEFAERFNVSKYVFVSKSRVFAKMFERAARIEPLGELHNIGGFNVDIATAHVHTNALQTIQTMYAISGSVLEM